MKDNEILNEITKIYSEIKNELNALGNTFEGYKNDLIMQKLLKWTFSNR